MNWFKNRKSKNLAIDSVTCIQFVDKYFNARHDVKHCKLKVVERDIDHLMIECKLEEEYINV
mgnify:CR=1 FL=1